MLLIHHRNICSDFPLRLVHQFAFRSVFDGSHSPYSITTSLGIQWKTRETSQAVYGQTLHCQNTVAERQTKEMQQLWLLRHRDREALHFLRPDIMNLLMHPASHVGQRTSRSSTWMVVHRARVYDSFCRYCVKCQLPVFKDEL